MLLRRSQQSLRRHYDVRHNVGDGVCNGVLLQVCTRF